MQKYGVKKCNRVQKEKGTKGDTMSKGKLNERQTQLLDIVRQGDGTLIDDVMHITQNDRSLARSSLNYLVKKGYLKKKAIKVHIVPKGRMLGLGPHLHPAAKYFLADPPPEQG